MSASEHYREIETRETHTVMEPNDVRECADGSPQFCEDRHACSVKQHGLGLELPPLLDPVDEERAGRTGEEVEGGQARKFDRVVLDDPVDGIRVSTRELIANCAAVAWTYSFCRMPPTDAAEPNASWITK